MKLTDFAIRKRVTVYVLVLLSVLAGSYAYVTLPREASPDITVPFVIVTTIYVGAPPQDVENLVTRKIEKELQGLEHVKEIRSTSAEGVSSITIEFNPSANIDDVLPKVKDKVDRARPELPSEAEDPIVSEVNLSNVPMMIVNLSGNYGLIGLKAVAEDLADEIETIRGVLEVRVVGGLDREIQVDIDPERLMLYGLAIQDVVDVIRRENVTMPGGSIEIGDLAYSVRVPGELKTAEAIAGLVVKSIEGRSIYVRDVAKVTDGYKDPVSYARLNQQPCVSLSVIKRSGENLIEIADEVKYLLAEKKAVFPTGTQVSILSDQSEDIRDMVKDLENNIITGLLLVIVVLFFFMGMRNAIFVGVAIPLSMLISFVVLSIMQITLNMVVLFSLILALGMLVDNGIVIVENIYRHRQEGKDPDDGARIGTGEVAVPVIASTLTTLCAFAPMIFWPGIMGEFMSYLPITLIITLTSSLVVGLIMNPTFCASFMTVKGSQDETSPTLQKVLGHYRRFLEGALDRPAKTLAGAGGTLGVVIVIYAFLGHGVEFFPKVEPGKAYINVRAASGTRLDVTDQIVRQIEKALVGVLDIKRFVANVGSSADGQGNAPNEGRISVDFVLEDKRTQSGFDTVEQIRTAVSGIAGATIEIDQEQVGPATGAPIAIEISGEDFKILGDLTEQVKRLAANVSGVVDLTDNFDRGRPEVLVKIDRDAAAIAGLNTTLISSTVRTALYGTEASEFRVDEDEYDIRVRFMESGRQRLGDLERLRVEKDGRLIPLGTVAQVEVGSGLGSIRRKDMKRVITVEGKVEGRTTNEAVSDIQKALDQLPLAAGYKIRFGGESDDQQEATAFLSKAFIIAIFMIALVLITQFDSVTLPFVVLSSVVLSLIGVLIGLLVTVTPFGIMMTGIGVISLAGVVVNNAIVLIDYAQLLQKKGLPSREVIIQAGVTRFRPVIMTAITTILGLLPLATGVSFDFFSFSWEVGGRSSQWWGPMGIAVVFGLAFATVLTLVVVPVMVQMVWKLTGIFKEKEAQETVASQVVSA